MLNENIIENLINRVSIYTGKDKKFVSNTINNNMFKILENFFKNRNMDDRVDKLLYETNKNIISPYKLKNAEEAAKIIKTYCDNENAAIFIFGDYDADGICAGYVMTDSLKRVSKCPVSVTLPERTDGYGMNIDFCKSLVENEELKNKDVLVITVDNGITVVDEIQYLLDNNINVIVTDHHMSLDKVPNCLIVNPHNDFVNDNTYGKNLSGCGVAFKVCQIVHELYGMYDMLKYTPYVGVSTLADVMSLDDENIAMVQYCLDILNSEQCPISFLSLKEACGFDVFTSENLLWEIVPRMNACGRMNATSTALKLFLSEHKVEAKILSTKINDLNKDRKSLTDAAIKKINRIDNFDNKVFIYISDSPEGINGIIAGRAVEHFGVPSIVVNKNENGICKGSVRSIPGVDIREHLGKLKNDNIIISFGGHSQSAGVSFDVTKKDDIINYFNENINIECLKADNNNKITNYSIDGEININDVNLVNYSFLNLFPSDGKTVSHPVLILKDIELTDVSVSKNNSSNIKFCFNKYNYIWAWGLADKYNKLGNPSKINIIGRISKDFMCKNKYTINVLDIESAI